VERALILLITMRKWYNSCSVRMCDYVLLRLAVLQHHTKLCYVNDVNDEFRSFKTYKYMYR